MDDNDQPIDIDFGGTTEAVAVEASASSSVVSVTEPTRNLASVEDLRLPAKLGRFTLLEKLGTGGMAEVFRGLQDGPAGFAKPVVVKRILPHLLDDKRFVAMFLREARVAAQLNHPHIVQIYELGEVDGIFFIAMELIEGASLHRLARSSWAQGKSLPVELVLSAIADAAGALWYAHTAKNSEGVPLRVVHRDISPDNLMIDRRGVTKVLDFGVAAAADVSPVVTRTGEVKGKLPYMPPEQIRGEPLTHQADLFSLGVTFYWLVCGRRPFVANNNAALMHSILHDEPAPPSQLNPALPREIDACVLSLLEKRPEERPSNGDDIAKQLLFWLRADRTAIGAFVSDVTDAPVPEGKVRGVPAAAPTTDSFVPGQAQSGERPTTATGEGLDVSKPISSSGPLPTVAPASVLYDQTTWTRSEQRTPGLAARLALVGATAIALVVGAWLVLKSPGANVPEEPKVALASSSTAAPPASSAAPTADGAAPRADGAAPTANGAAPTADGAAPPAAAADPLQASGADVPAPEATARGSKARSSSATLRSLHLAGPRSVRWSTVDGKRLGSGTVDVKVAAGTSAVVAYDAARAVVTEVPVAGERVDYAKLPTAELDIRAFPFAEVTAGSTKLGTTPFPPLRVVVGEHTLRFVHDGEEQVQQVSIRAGERKIVKATFGPR